MNTFWRYFLHFTSIPLILSIIMGALAFFDSGIKINGKVVLLFIVAIFVFSLPMTTFYFKYAVDNETISINSDNPEIPEGYEWSLGIIIFNKDGSSIGYNAVTRVPNCIIPREGSFKKEATYITNTNNIRSFKMLISINHIDMDNTGLLDILYYPDGSKKRAEFVPEDTFLFPLEEYTDNFDFSRMFQWK
jgi:hypothetical protein